MSQPATALVAGLHNKVREGPEQTQCVYTSTRIGKVTTGKCRAVIGCGVKLCALHANECCKCVHSVSTLRCILDNLREQSAPPQPLTQSQKAQFV